jgi:hypothetical protein
LQGSDNEENQMRTVYDRSQLLLTTHFRRNYEWKSSSYTLLSWKG